MTGCRCVLGVDRRCENPTCQLLASIAFCKRVVENSAGPRVYSIQFASHTLLALANPLVSSRFDLSPLRRRRLLFLTISRHHPCRKGATPRISWSFRINLPIPLRCKSHLPPGRQLSFHWLAYCCVGGARTAHSTAQHQDHHRDIRLDVN